MRRPLRNGPVPITPSMKNFVNEAARKANAALVRLRRVKIIQQLVKKGTWAGESIDLGNWIVQGPRGATLDVRVSLEVVLNPKVVGQALSSPKYPGRGLIDIYAKPAWSGRSSVSFVPADPPGFQPVLMHEIVHLFDPKVRDTRLKDLDGRVIRKAQADVLDAVDRGVLSEMEAAHGRAWKAYFQTPSEVDAFMTERIFDLTENWLGGYRPSDLPRVKRQVLAEDIPALARSFSTKSFDDRYDNHETSPYEAWADDPLLWRKFISRLVRAVEDYPDRDFLKMD